MMETYPWWSLEQKKLADEARRFANVNLSRGEEIAWTKEFPDDLVREVARKGWFGAAIPKKYEGMETGLTGCGIIAEELARTCWAIAGSYLATVISMEPLLKWGDETQKQQWIPKTAKGEKLGAVCITEPSTGSDAAGIETTAVLEGDIYNLNGKKRFITNIGVADIYLVYAKTSDSTEDKAKYTQLSAFIVEKGAKGLTVERINELGGWAGLPTGCLNFDDVKVPIKNRIGEAGDGWKILVEELNQERSLFAACMLGAMREAVKYAVGHAQRRVQFGEPAVKFEENQFKIADMLAGLRSARLMTYFSLYLVDSGADTAVDSALAKLYTSETYELLVAKAQQVMGGDGLTRFYPVETFIRDARVNHVATGTSEVMRMILVRQGLQAMADELMMPHRRIHPKLGVPTSTIKPEVVEEVSEKTLLEVLAEDYLVNPGLYMSRNHIKERLAEASDDLLNRLCTSLEAKGLIKLWKDKRGNIELVKATYKGLKQAQPLEYYQWFPRWMRKDLLF